jgi:hypothetical protein
MVVPMVVPAQPSEALKSWGLVPMILTLAMVKAVGPRLTRWMTRAALVVWTSCVPKDSVSGMSTRAGGDAAVGTGTSVTGAADGRGATVGRTGVGTAGGAAVGWVAR